MTVLILASERDLSADAMVRMLGERGVPVFRADVDWFPQRLTLDAELHDGRWVGRLATAHREVSLQDVRSVWYRSPSAFRFPAAMSPAESRHAGHEAKLGLGGVLGSLPVLWVNHPGRHADAGHKPRQLVAAASAGLDVAPTLVTNDAAAVRRFAAGSGPAGVVTKMLGAPAICEQGGRRIALTQHVTLSDLDDLRGVELTAHQYQWWAPKHHEARVIVIGQHVFAVAIHAGSPAAHVDWRADYDALTYQRILPPVAVARGVLAVTSDLVRLVGGCDRRAPDRHLGRSAHPRCTVTHWADRAAELAEELVAAGKLRSPEWIAAVGAVPRHTLVPVFYEQDPGTGDWLTRDGTDPAGHDQIYANRALYTKIGHGTGSWGTAVVGLSSTSTPGLMTRMLEALDIHDGHRVLEIGTGTGYNAALLAHRLGGTHVYSVDIEHDLINLARTRLAAIGYRPTLVATDGAHGLPEHAPYDRVIATCSVPAIPWAWIAQTRVGGLILADLKLSVHAGNLVLLRRHPDRAEGRFDRTWAGFMALRHTGADTSRLPPPTGGRSPAHDRAHAARRTSDLEQLRPWDNLVAWFLAQLSVPTEIGYGHLIDEQTGRPGNVLLTSGDGSWCEVSAHTEGGTRQVWEAGPIPLWRVAESACHLWTTLGRPDWDRFGLTATADQQWIWLDTPDSDHTWPLRS